MRIAEGLYHSLRVRQSIGDGRFKADHLGVLANVGEPLVRQADPSSFVIGEDLHWFLPKEAASPIPCNT